MKKDSNIIRCGHCGAGNRVKINRLHLEPLCGKCKTPLTFLWKSPVSITDSTFEQEVVKSPLPVLVDFWSPRCGPCTKAAPVMDQIAQEMAGKLKVCKIDIDQNMSSAARFNVNAVPTFLLFRRGILLDTMQGVLPRDAMINRITRFINN